MDKSYSVIESVSMLCSKFKAELFSITREVCQMYPHSPPDLMYQTTNGPQLGSFFSLLCAVCTCLICLLRSDLRLAACRHRGHL